MITIDKNELITALKNKYYDISSDCGAYISTENGREWLSIARIIEIIENCKEYKN